MLPHCWKYSAKAREIIYIESQRFTSFQIHDDALNEGYLKSLIGLR